MSVIGKKNFETIVQGDSSWSIGSRNIGWNIFAVYIWNSTHSLPIAWLFFMELSLIKTQYSLMMFMLLVIKMIRMTLMTITSTILMLMLLVIKITRMTLMTITSTIMMLMLLLIKMIRMTLMTLTSTIIITIIIRLFMMITNQTTVMLTMIMIMMKMCFKKSIVLFNILVSGSKTLQF